MSARTLVESLVPEGNEDVDWEEYPQGWWMDPAGELYDLDDKDHHHKWARRYIAQQQQAGTWVGRALIDSDIGSEPLFDLGWVRIVREDSELYVEKLSGTPNVPGQLTVSQRRAVRDLADDMGIDDVYRVGYRGVKVSVG